MDKTSLKTNANTLSEESVLNWQIIQKDFEKSFGAEVYSSWLKNILLVKEYNDYVILGVPTRFFRDWITSRYADRILSELKRHKLSINRIEFKIESFISVILFLLESREIILFFNFSFYVYPLYKFIC